MKLESETSTTPNLGFVRVHPHAATFTHRRHTFYFIFPFLIPFSIPSVTLIPFPIPFRHSTPRFRAATQPSYILFHIPSFLYPSLRSSPVPQLDILRAREQVCCFAYLLRLKRDEHGKDVRYKARLVAQGFSQKPGTDYSESGTLAPVMRFESLRTMLAFAAQNG